MAENPEQKHADFSRLILFKTISFWTSRATPCRYINDTTAIRWKPTGAIPPWPYISRRRAAVARVAHNHEAAGSNPAAATKISYVPWLIHLHLIHPQQPSLHSPDARQILLSAGQTNKTRTMSPMGMKTYGFHQLGVSDTEPANPLRNKREGYHKMTQPYRCPDCGLTIEHPGRKCPFCGSRITKLKSDMLLRNKSMEPTETVNKSTIVAFCIGLLSIIFPLLCILPTMGIIASRMALIQCQTGRSKGYMLAKAGLVCSGIGFILGIFSIIMLVIGLVFYMTVT